MNSEGKLFYFLLGAGSLLGVLVWRDMAAWNKLWKDIPEDGPKGPLVDVSPKVLSGEILRNDTISYTMGSPGVLNGNKLVPKRIRLKGGDLVDLYQVIMIEGNRFWRTNLGYVLYKDVAIKEGFNGFSKGNRGIDFEFKHSLN